MVGSVIGYFEPETEVSISVIGCLKKREKSKIMVLEKKTGRQITKIFY